MKDLELMEKWHTMAVLHNVEVPNIDNWSDDDDDFMYLLEELETMNRRIAEPSNSMRFALSTIDMGVSHSDIEHYIEYLSQKEHAEREEARKLAEKTNLNIKNLVEQYSFRFVKSKQYPDHTHFAFTAANGIEVKGRIFRYSWRCHRVWTSWKGAKGTLERRMWAAHHADVTIPAGFPASWTEDYSYTSDPVRMAYCIAHMINSKSLPKAAKILYPKKK